MDTFFVIALCLGDIPGFPENMQRSSDGKLASITGYSISNVRR